MDQCTLSSGTVLSDRYRLEDLISESSGASTWLARDELLNRRVGVQAIPWDDSRAAGFAAAARQSTSVTDPRFLRVLDIAEEDHGHTYLVREWARALPLDLVLTQSTLTNRRAATIVSEIAEAIGDAHEAGVYHRHLRPGCVLLKESGAVRITGLAVDHAIHSPDPDPEHADMQYAEQLDVTSLGKLLYACLSGRWPGGGNSMLRKAPTEHGRLLRPRQVRAGVSRDVDAVCDRILASSPRHHQPPLRSARQIAHELRLAGEDETFRTDDQPSLIESGPASLFGTDSASETPPAVNPPKPRPKALAPPPPSTLERGMARARRATEGDRALIWTGIAVAVVLAATMAFIIGRASTDTTPNADDGTQPGGDGQTAESPTTTLPIEAAADFDPQGSDSSENPEDAPLAVDGDATTGWSTLEYYGRPDLGGLKDGVGLLIDLGENRVVESVQLRFGAAPTTASLLAAPPGTTEPPTSTEDLRRLGEVRAETEEPVSMSQSVITRFIVVWLTELPPESEDVFRGKVQEVVVQGPA